MQYHAILYDSVGLGFHVHLEVHPEDRSVPLPPTRGPWEVDTKTAPPGVGYTP